MEHDALPDEQEMQRQRVLAIELKRQRRLAVQQEGDSVISHSDSDRSGHKPGGVRERRVPGTPTARIIDAMTPVDQAGGSDDTQSDQGGQHRAHVVRTIVFSDSQGELGKVVIDGDQIKPDYVVADIVRSHEARGLSADDFLERYSNWSNGYVHSKLVQP